MAAPLAESKGIVLEKPRHCTGPASGLAAKLC